MDEFLGALDNYLNVSAEYRRKTADYDGYEFDWDFRHAISEHEEAQKAVESALEKYVDERIKKHKEE